MENIVISNTDLVEHTVLMRKKTETAFRMDFLMRKGAKEDDVHIISLKKQIADIDNTLKPLSQKLNIVDLTTIVPNRKKIAELTAKIEEYSKERLDEAMKKKSGEIYELLKQRAVYTKKNFENKEQIAKMTIILNLLPKSSLAGLKNIIETGTDAEVDISVLDDAKKQDLVTSMGRIGMIAFISNSKLSLDKKKVEGLEYLSWPHESIKKITDKTSSAKRVWVSKENDEKWDINEAEFFKVTKKIQMLITKRQAVELTEEEKKEFEDMQKRYIELRDIREKLINKNIELSISVPPKKKENLHEVGKVEQMDLGPQREETPEGEKEIL